MSIYVKTNLGVSNVSESIIQFVENKPYSQIYDIGHKLIRVASGSRSVDSTRKFLIICYTEYN